MRVRNKSPLVLMVVSKGVSVPLYPGQEMEVDMPNEANQRLLLRGLIVEVPVDSGGKVKVVGVSEGKDKVEGGGRVVEEPVVEKEVEGEPVVEVKDKEVRSLGAEERKRRGRRKK